MLCVTKFANLVQSAPLVSIDLIIMTEKGVLLGRRKNQPAKGFWFVPGGRVLKDETIELAVKRISFKEINLEKKLNDLHFIGVYEHFYENSFVSENVTTHYVVLAFELECDLSLSSLPSTEHNEYRFFSSNDIENDPLVHSNTKNYFNSKGIV